MSLQHPPAASASPRTMSVAAVTPRRDPPQRVSRPTPSSHVPEHSPPPPDVLSHPAVSAWLANHPTHPVPKFGAYYMLQTLGEGEFGKVKLGIHSKFGEEVAVKLIRRDTVDSEAKMVKIAREIELLDKLKHPNIVRLYDVVETDKFFGIVLEYASGGELFDHILAHRYLRERDAAKLFSQLISGVWYMHQNEIVHRDLKLENLLLDRNHNLIITDFGFANRFTRGRNDLLETMCGSPCYAAPELINSAGDGPGQGHYVGTAADVWSCGVILYAMLSGYLPFDDDPTNPDAEDIGKLYKYISRTPLPLAFAAHLSAEARGLLSMMLVPDPRRRADIGDVMRHRWFGVNLQEGVAMFGLTMKELERMAEEGGTRGRLAYRRGVNGNGRHVDEETPRKERQRSKRNNPPQGGETSPTHRDGKAAESARAGSPPKDTIGSLRKPRGDRDKGRRERERTRHTIEVVNGNGSEPHDTRDQRERQRGPTEGRRMPATSMKPLPAVHDGDADAVDGGRHRAKPESPMPESERRSRAGRASASAQAQNGAGHGSPNMPPRTRRTILHVQQAFSSLESTTSTTTAEAEYPPSSETTLGRTEKTDDTMVDGSNGHLPMDSSSTRARSNPIRSLSDTPRASLTKSAARTLLAPLRVGIGASASPSGAGAKQQQPITATSTERNVNDVPAAVSASKPSKVMQWFRRGRRSTSASASEGPTSAVSEAAAASSVEVASVPHPHKPSRPQTPAKVSASASPFLFKPGTGEHRQRTSSNISITSIFRRSTGVAGGNGKTALRVHHGAVDHEMITAGKPPEVMQHVRGVLEGMGVDVQEEGDFKYRCARPARRRPRAREGWEGKIGADSAPPAGGGVLRGLLSRRPSPARSTLGGDNSSSPSIKHSVSTDERPDVATVYGHQYEDIGDEVRFSVELTRLDRLKDMYSVDVRRLKGNLKSYKFLYDTIRMRIDLRR